MGGEWVKAPKTRSRADKHEKLSRMSAVQRFLARGMQSRRQQIINAEEAILTWTTKGIMWGKKARVQ